MFDMAGINGGVFQALRNVRIILEGLERKGYSTLNTFMELSSHELGIKRENCCSERGAIEPEIVIVMVDGCS